MNPTCRCGHKLKEHNIHSSSRECLAVIKNGPLVSHTKSYDMCLKFEPDNLSIIEALAEERGLI